MGRVQTDTVSLRAAREASIGVLPGTPKWRVLEWNDITAFGAEIITTARNPVTTARGRRKGVPTDLNSPAGFVTDLTLDAIVDFAEGLIFAEFANVEFDLKASTGTVPPPAVASTDAFTIDAASATLGGKMVYAATGARTMVFAKGYSTNSGQNNGLHVLRADVASTNTAVQVDAVLVDETPPTNASLQIAGVEIDTGDVTLTINGDGTATLVSAAHVANWATLGLFKGMHLHLGGVDSDGAHAANGLTFTPGTIADDVVEVNGVYYQWAADPTAGTPDGSSGDPYLVDVGVDDETSLANLLAAINASGTGGVTYSVEITEPHATVEATASDATTITLESRLPGTIGNAYTLSVTGDDGVAADAALFSGGAVASFAVQNAFDDAGTDDVYGFARIRAVSGATLTLDKLDDNLGAGGSPYTNSGLLHILFGRYLRNVPVDANSTDSKYQALTYQLEAAYPNLGDAAATEYEYAVGNFVDVMTWNKPEANLMTIEFGFVGTNTEAITASRKTGASTAVSPLRTVAFNTSSSYASITTDLISAASDICFKTLTTRFFNGVSPEKCQGTLGARFVNAGVFGVDVEGEMAFTRKEIINAIRNNDTVTLGWIVRNEDGGIALDVPEMTVTGGAKSYPRAESVRVSLTFQSFTSAEFGHDVAMTFFPILPIPAV